MRNYLTLAFALLIAASPALASRARLEALGESKNGSLYIDDSRNIFYNPAFINNYKKKLWLELGTSGSTSADGTAADTATPSTNQMKPEGGFSNTMGDFAYGLYLGHESDRTWNFISGINSLSGTPYGTFIGPTNAIDFFFGGEAGIKWGANVFYAGNESKSATNGMDQTFSEYGVRLGVIASQFQAFATVGIAAKAVGAQNVNALIDTTGATDQLKGSLALDLGATYALSDNHTVFAKFTTNGFEYDNGASTAKYLSVANTTAELGIGHKKDITKNSNVFARFEAAYAQQATTTASTGAKTTAKQWNLPLSIGVETAALSWLTIRGSIAESILGQNIGTGTSGTGRSNWFGSTNVAAGLGMTFGDVQIDGLVATTGGANSSPDAIGDSNSYTATNGTFGFSNMLTRVSMTYKF